MPTPVFEEDHVVASFTWGELVLFSLAILLILAMLAIVADLMWIGLRRTEGEEASFALTERWTVARRMEPATRWPLALAIFVVVMIVAVAVLITGVNDPSVVVQ